MRYKVLKQEAFLSGNYALVPLRTEDILLIKQWRNDQINILRQKSFLTDEQQILYFNNVIRPLFDQDYPEQLLFSFLYADKLVGYGGLVHIDWESLRAEISFLLETTRNNDVGLFQEDFENYLKLIKKVAFEDLNLKKINTEAYDIRPYLYSPLEKSGFMEEARLKWHNYIEGNRVDTIFHSFFSRSYVSQENKEFNILVTSISRKIPMLNCLRNAFNKLSVNGKLFGGDMDETCIGRYFVDVFWKMPALTEGIFPQIIDYCLNNNIRTIIPSRDGELTFWSSHRSIFREYGINVMVSDVSAINNTIDKLNFYRCGIELGYPVIQTTLDIAELNGERYVVKERLGAGSKSIGLNLTIQEARRHALQLSEPIFQPFINGKEYSIDLYLTFDGRIKGAVSRSRDKIVDGESQITITASIPELEELCSNFSQKINLSGHIVFQVLIDQNNQYHIVECNARFGGASTLSITAGLDSFYWLLLESMGKDIVENKFVKNNNPIKQVRYSCDRISYI